MPNRDEEEDISSIKEFVIKRLTGIKQCASGFIRFLNLENGNAKQRD